MVLTIGAKYILRFIIKGHELVYEAIITGDDGKHISFTDKFGQSKEYSRAYFMTAEEVKNVRQ